MLPPPATQQPVASPWAHDDPQSDAVIAALRAHTGVDVAEFRRPTLDRRILNRMISVGVRSHAAYLRLLEASRDEAYALLDRVAIKVSHFYRNAATFDLLRHTVLPGLAAAAGGRPLRIWSAGCGHGQEAWTLAMLLHDGGINGSIESTDIDPGALCAASVGCYPVKDVAQLPGDLAVRYIRPDSGTDQVSVAPVLRTRVRFTRHDLLSGAAPPGDGPFDLICCRNVLIYFQRAAQERTLELFRRHVAPDGALCLGEAEWPTGSAMLWCSALAPRARIFHAVPVVGAVA